MSILTMYNDVISHLKCRFSGLFGVTPDPSPYEALLLDRCDLDDPLQQE